MEVGPAYLGALTFQVASSYRDASVVHRVAEVRPYPSSVDVGSCSSAVSACSVEDRGNLDRSHPGDPVDFPDRQVAVDHQVEHQVRLSIQEAYPSLAFLAAFGAYPGAWEVSYP